MSDAAKSSSSPSTPATTGRLSPEELRSLVASGEVDTVLLAFVDMQGRLQGKQLGAPYFLSDVLDHGAGACSYLLSVEVEMAPQEGLSTSSWETSESEVASAPGSARIALSRVAASNAARSPCPNRASAAAIEASAAT